MYLSIICSLPTENGIEFVLSRVNDCCHESENGFGYLVTHLDIVDRELDDVKPLPTSWTTLFVEGLTAVNVGL